MTEEEKRQKTQTRRRRRGEDIASIVAAIWPRGSRLLSCRRFFFDDTERDGRARRPVKTVNRRLMKREDGKTAMGAMVVVSCFEVLLLRSNCTPYYGDCYVRTFTRGSTPPFLLLLVFHDAPNQLASRRANHGGMPSKSVQQAPGVLMLLEALER